MDLVESIHGQENKRHPWEIARFMVINNLLAPFKANLKKEALLLDIGCGDTYFIECLSKKIPDVLLSGIDAAFTAETLSQLKKRYSGTKLSVFMSLDEAVEKLNKTAAVIFLMDIIEHIKDDRSFLQNLHKNKCVDNKTLFLITVPAYQSLFSNHDKFLLHERRYNLSQLKSLLNSSGLQIISSGYFFILLLFPRIIKKVIEKISAAKRLNEKGIGGWQGGKVKTKLITRILYADYLVAKLFRAIGISLPGLTVFALCRKPV